MLQQRVFTALALLGIMLACLFWLPSAAWNVLVTIPLLIGLTEWSRLSGLTTGQSVVYAFVGISVSLLVWFAHMAVWLYVASCVLWLLVVPLWLIAGWRLASAWLRLPLGMLVLVPMWMSMIELRHQGAWWVLGLMMVVWIADSAAYFTGRAMGRHKLAPAISPGKTWEGVLGALIGVLLYGGVLVYFLGREALNPGAWLVPVLLFLVLMLYLGIIGDLFESWIKRLADVKDSGHLLPGHGGVLDRIDALTSTLPVAALIILHSELLQGVA